MYAETVAPVVLKMLDGYNCSVLAYGQTGSGKTYTMEGGLAVARRRPNGSIEARPPGDEADAMGPPPAGGLDASACVETLGIIPRAVHTIFRHGDAGGTRRYWVYVSHMEIYNERLFDLLAHEDTAGTPPPRSPAKQSASLTRTSPASSPYGTLSGVGFTHEQRRPASGKRGYCHVSRNRDDLNSSLQPDVPPESTKLGQHSGVHVGGLPSPVRRSPVGCNDSFPSSPKASRSGTNPENGRLRSEAGKNMGKGLAIEEHPDLGVMVKGLTQIEVNGPEEIFAVIARSKRNRRTAEVRWARRFRVTLICSTSEPGWSC